MDLIIKIIDLRAQILLKFVLKRDKSKQRFFGEAIRSMFYSLIPKLS